MGISSNQARFLALTSRQVDLERRIQQICQRRLRLTSELENVATSYNNLISNRRLYTFDTSGGGIDALSIAGINSLKDINGNNYALVGVSSGAYTTGVTAGAGANALVFTTNGTATNITKASLGLPDTATTEECLDAGIRAGILVIACQPDEFTQSPTAIGNSANGTTANYEIKDWRSLPSFADELYKGDNVDAENKYDKTIEEINAQDKKLQLEQTSIEVEYKAVSSERESVKKILDTNAQSSFKYFS